jgi:deoxyribose-phosphate aldolase
MTAEEVVSGCMLAREYDCVSVCVKPCDVESAYKTLEGSNVLTTTVIGFPHGSNLTEVKLKESELAIDQGCAEIDVVQNIGRVKGGDFDYVAKELRAICDYAHSRNVIVKIILENAYLTTEEKVTSCRISEESGADFVKTSTGYANGGATIADLKLMRSTCSPSVRLKAAGGVRSLEAALMVKAVGGSRFGCTRTEQIMKDARQLEAEGKLILPDPALIEVFPQG